jgi:hypothetical protein
LGDQHGFDDIDMQPWLRFSAVRPPQERLGTAGVVPHQVVPGLLGDLSIGVGWKLEALLISTSSRPKRLTVSFTMLGATTY